ncbi:maleylpyruvate isomerase N-terminal domain-containing protein [Terrabacter sp. LjRoot27]|uniref:maleylpyruvate isomerase N-terminal domain-containing protein n=1 Tax=Terrabacter sp. LjRoot27 TaxID=3342306 RepID=UPI003ECCC62B
MTTATTSAPFADPRPITDLLPAVAAECRRVLEAAVDRDWDEPAGDLDWSCRGTAAHVADVLFSYAGQVVAQPDGAYLPMEVTVEDAATPDRLVASVVACAQLLHLACAAAPDRLRAWHPAGVADAEGFAAMGVVEVLVHTHDIALGLGLGWAPPQQLSRPVLPRLFPQAPDGDPTEVLLWCCGRAALPDRPRLDAWRWDPTVRGRPGTGGPGAGSTEPPLRWASGGSVRCCPSPTGQPGVPLHEHPRLLPGRPEASLHPVDDRGAVS